MSFNDARFNSHNSYKTSYVKDPNWEWLRRSLVLASESAPPSSGQRGVRASERGSQLLNLKRSASQCWEQLSKTTCKYIRRISRYNSVPDWNEINLRHYMYPYVPLRGGNKYKKKTVGPKSRWGGVGPGPVRLSQTSPIPRSPDGDNNEKCV